MFDAGVTLQEPEQHPVMSHERRVASGESMRRQLIIDMTGGTNTQVVQRSNAQQHHPTAGEAKVTL